MLAKLFYTAESDGDDRFLFILDHVEGDIPGINLDEIDSFTFSADKDVWPHYLRKPTDIMRVFVQQNDSAWGRAFTNASIPVVALFCVTNASQFPTLKQFDRPLFIYYTNKKMEYHAWLDTIISDLSMVSKCYLADFYEGILTKDPHMIRAALRQRHNKAYMDAQQQEKYDTISRMHHWYKNDAREIIDAAKEAIQHFVITKKYNKYIPDFLVVPIYHITRYHKAYKLLVEKHPVEFIMTLPVTVAEKRYTILFPVVAESK